MGTEGLITFSIREMQRARMRSGEEKEGRDGRPHRVIKNRDSQDQNKGKQKRSDSTGVHTLWTGSLRADAKARGGQKPAGQWKRRSRRAAA